MLSAGVRGRRAVGLPVRRETRTPALRAVRVRRPAAVPRARRADPRPRADDGRGRQRAGARRQGAGVQRRAEAGRRPPRKLRRCLGVRCQQQRQQLCDQRQGHRPGDARQVPAGLHMVTARVRNPALSPSIRRPEPPGSDYGPKTSGLGRSQCQASLRVKYRANRVHAPRSIFYLSPPPVILMPFAFIAQLYFPWF